MTDQETRTQRDYVRLAYRDPDRENKAEYVRMAWWVSNHHERYLQPEFTVKRVHGGNVEDQIECATLELSDFRRFYSYEQLFDAQKTPRSYRSYKVSKYDKAVAEGLIWC